MSKTNATRSKSDPSQTVQPLQENDNVIVNTTISKSIYSRLLKYKEAHGLMTDPEVIRLALAAFLSRGGF